MNRLPAEWEQMQAVLIAWPHKLTDWLYMLDEVTACYIEIAQAIAKRSKLIIAAPEGCEIPQNIPHTRLVVDTNDTWARDFGPISTIEDGRVVLHDFKFNGWGLKFAACHDNLITSALHRELLSGMEYDNCLGFVLEGGSIDTDGRGTILTTQRCLLSPNRNGNLDIPEISDMLVEKLGAGRVIWLGDGELAGDDTDAHIDTLARFASEDTIVYTACDRLGDDHYQSLKDMEADLAEIESTDGQAYKLIPLPIPEPIYDEDGCRLPATYANFLILNGAVLLPIYADEHYDKIAIENVSKAFPGYEIVPIDCRALIRQHGSLHCITMNIPT